MFQLCRMRSRLLLGIGRTWFGQRKVCIWHRNILAGIPLAFNLRNIGRWNFSPVQFIPVDLGEPGVGKNVGGASTQVSVPLGEITNEQVLQQLFGQAVEVRGVPDLSSDDLSAVSTPNLTGATYLLVQLHGIAVLREERGVACLKISFVDAVQTHQHLED